jgi:hypothetical protein
MNPILVDGLCLACEIVDHTVLHLVQRSHLGDLAPKRRDFTLHPPDLDLGQLCAKYLDFIPQTLDPTRILSIRFHPSTSKDFAARIRL